MPEGGRALLAVAARPADFDPKASKGLGKQVVGLLVKQGALVAEPAWTGARYIVTLPLSG